MKNKKNSTWKKIQKIREELEKSPNGWPLCKIVGAEYINTRVYKRMRNE